MPNRPTVSYPGVYVQELPSGVRTISMLETATTAFIGSAARGPDNQPRQLNSFHQYQHLFGELSHSSAMSYSVRDFFSNGGSKAIIVRLSNGATRAEVAIGGLVLEASNPGRWGNQLQVRLSAGDEGQKALVAEGLHIAPELLFNLSIRDAGTGAIENYEYLSIVDSPRRIDTVLARDSALLTVKGKLPPKLPAMHPSTNAAIKRSDPWQDPTLFSRPTTLGSDGDPLTDELIVGDAKANTGMHALKQADHFNLLCIPPYQEAGVSANVWQQAAQYCEDHRALLLVDPPVGWTTVDKAIDGFPIPGFAPSANAAVFYPNLQTNDPLADYKLRSLPPSGAIAGIIARTDVSRGVWKAPAGVQATIETAARLTVTLTDADLGRLNPLGINGLRTLPATGPVVWGARTMVGDDRLSSEWKYIPVRRTALAIEESLLRGTTWAVFEPNDEPLWAQLRQSTVQFLDSLFRQGAFQGSSAADAYFVKCGADTTTQADIDQGVVNIIVGFAPLKPAEFVVLHIRQTAGQNT